MSVAGTSPSPRRARARRGEGERLREEILAATDRLLVTTGDEEAVSIRAVAQAVGVTPPSIYLHFADKDDLIWAVCEEHFRELDEASEAAAGEAGDDPAARLRARGVAYVRFGLDNPEHYRILFMGGQEGPERFTPERMARIAAFDHLVAEVQACIDAGVVRPIDPAVAACVLWMTVHGLTSLLISKPGFPWPPRDELVDAVIDNAFVGLRAN